MRNYLIVALLFASIIINAQTKNDSAIFLNAHGLTRNNSQYLEIEGYSVFTYDHDDLFFDKGGIKIAKRKYKIDKNDLGSVDTLIQSSHKVFVTDYKISEGLSQKSIYYFTPVAGNKLRVIGFSIQPTRDIEIERLFVNHLLNNDLPNYIYTKPDIDSVNFAGRYLPLGSACRWMSPHNIQCPDFGQISWSEFRTKERANEIINSQYEITANRGMGEVIEKDSINVIIEGQDSKALRLKYKIKIPRFVMGGSNILIIYYISTEIRGKYVACVMSQYTDDVNGNKLAPLLSLVMKLKE